MKRCTKCGRLLPETEFYKVSHTERLKPTCKECDKEYARAYYAAHARIQGRIPRKKKEKKPRRRKKTSLTTERCKSCIYRTPLISGDDVACYYIAVTGKMRRSPAGDKCRRYKEGKPAPVPASIRGTFKFEDKRDGRNGRARSHKVADE